MTGAALNIAATWRRTRSLGPGVRSVAWVQGCPFSCPGCVSPEWIPFTAANAYSPEQLAETLLAHSAGDSSFEGLTFSGGEPMEQAEGLAATMRAARSMVPHSKKLSLICYTGYRLERLRRDPPNPGVADLLALTDVLIDGRYVAARNDDRGLRGSSNQRVHHLTDRYRDRSDEFERGRRRVEVRIRPDGVQMVGVPGTGVASALNVASALDRAVTNSGDPR
ncbi:4Fe-4S single cluster domain-containing protein [Cryptosporangium sp. NPDC051539]|uniref:4Fe-4S single cluster domain-containing protein n=1 Tax=Cryptosporangium sp. NPDC051539 TaxID=3363962 RepID=UPI003788F382